MTPRHIHKFYKAFQAFRTGLIAIAVCFYALGSGDALAQRGNPLFTVENVVVDVSAENALKARDQAFEEAQVRAFEVLAGQMLADTGSFEMPPLMTISTMIQDYEVSDEKLSSKRYTGTYKFRFKEGAVTKYLSGQGQEYTNVVSAPILVLPFLETGTGTTLWSPENGWMKAWASASNLSGGLVPLAVPLGDLSDVADIGDEDALSYKRRSLDALVQRYGASEAVIAIAQAEGTGLSVQIYRTDRTQPEYVHQILERSLPGQTQEQLYARAVQSVKKALSTDWKKKTVVDTRQQGSVQVHVAFSSLQEWANVQRALGRVHGLAGTQLKALSPKDAYLELTYEGTLTRLKLALEQAGLYLEPRGVSGISPASGGGDLNADYSQGMLGRYGYNVRPREPEPEMYELYTARPSRSAQPSYSGGAGSGSSSSPSGSSSYQTRF